MLLDSFAWMEYFMGTHKGEKVKTPDFGLADAIILASARSRNMKVLTGDPHFKNFKDAVML